MIIKTVKYTDLDGNEVEETLRFHLSKDEIMEINSEYKGGIEGFLADKMSGKDNNDQLDEESTKALYNLFKELVLRSYGEKSADAKHFIKSDEIRENFITSLAYEALMDSLMDGQEFVSFVVGIVGVKPEELEKLKKDALSNPNISPSIKKAIEG